MNILYNILFVVTIIGMLIGCSAGDDADGCCGVPGIDWMDDEAREFDYKIRNFVGIPSIILFMAIFFSHWHFGVKLLGLF